MMNSKTENEKAGDNKGALSPAIEGPRSRAKVKNEA
jgi:hypothetical protein